MKKVEILDEIKINTEAIDAILAKGSVEQRSLDTAEINKLTDLKSRNIELNNLLTNEEKKIEKMEEKFSFIRSLNAIVNGQQIDGVNKEVINQGQAMLRSAGLVSGGQLVVPTQYLRSGVVTLADNAIQSTMVDQMNVIADSLVFTKAGAFYGVYNSEFVLPSMSQSTAVWADENADSTDGAGTITSVKLSPKRLTAFVDVSKKFIAMDNIAAEQMIINDIVSAVSRAIEKAVLGKAAGSTTQPAGLFYVAPTVKGAISYANVVKVEENLVSANGFTGSASWIVNPKVKTLFRTTAKVTNGQVIMEDSNTALSYPLYTSNYVASGLQTGLDEYGAALADWSKLVIAQFGDAIDLTVDPYTLASKGEVRITVNFYADAAFRNSAYYSTASFK